MSKPRKKKRPPKRVLALPDLEQSKAAVLNTLTSKSGQRSYDRAITDFVDWYCSEPRLAFNRTVVLRYRIFLEQKQYAATTINLRLAAVRRVAFEAADSGLLSPELAAGIRRVKGVRRIGVRVGNWLTAEQAKRLLAVADRGSLRGKRDYAMIAMLPSCRWRAGPDPISAWTHFDPNDANGTSAASRNCALPSTTEWASNRAIHRCRSSVGV